MFAIETIEQKELSPIEMAKNLVTIEKEIEQLEEQKETLRKALLGVMQEQDVYSLKTGNYTLSRVAKITPKVLSVERLKQQLDKRNIPYYTQEVFAPSMNKVFTELAKKDPEIKDFGLPGLAIKETEYVRVLVTK